MSQDLLNAAVQRAAIDYMTAAAKEALASAGPGALDGVAITFVGKRIPVSGILVGRDNDHMPLLSLATLSQMSQHMSELSQQMLDSIERTHNDDSTGKDRDTLGRSGDSQPQSDERDGAAADEAVGSGDAASEGKDQPS